jgi:hypothetical protein
MAERTAAATSGGGDERRRRSYHARMGPGLFRLLCNVYPPYLGAGIRVAHVAPDWRHIRVVMSLRFYNRNYVGTHFGGSLFSMTDPFFMIMVMKNLGDQYLVWDKAGEIEFVAPGRGRVTADLALTADDLDELRARTTDGGKYLRWFETAILGADRQVVARVRKQLYVRRRA